MILEVKVTAMDIEYGVSRYEACPIALALRRLGFKKVLVGRTWVQVQESRRHNTVARYYPVNRDEMSEIVSAFDNGEQIQPFTLSLRKE